MISMENSLPPIPAKRYFTIGEVGELCDVKPHVLRYWEQEFTQLRPVKRRGNRRYYQHHEVLMIRRIRGLLYDQGFTIVGARNKMQELAQLQKGVRKDLLDDEGPEEELINASQDGSSVPAGSGGAIQEASPGPHTHLPALRKELMDIRDLLTA
jgi:DNA-binding transcriptional MerR regulator